MKCIFLFAVFYFSFLLCKAQKKQMISIPFLLTLPNALSANIHILMDSYQASVGGSEERKNFNGPIIHVNKQKELLKP